MKPGVRNGTSNHGPRTNEETELWRAVLRITFEDATGLFTDSGGLTKSYMRATKAHSRNFLLTDQADFEEICGLAGYDPEYVREKARKLIVDTDT